MAPRKDVQMLAKLYAKEMEYLSFGHACYHYASSKVVKPGAVGYFGHRGEWNNIINLRDLQPSAPDPARGIASKFARLDEEIAMMDEEEMVWGPLTSEHTKGYGAECRIEAPIPAGVLASGGIDSSYHTSNIFGAVLVTQGPVKRSRIDREERFSVLARQNEKLFPQLRSEVRNFGVWIVTNTFSTIKLSLNVWRDAERSVKLGFSTGLEGIVEVAPGVELENASRNDGWFQYESKDSNEVVCFVGGIRACYKSRTLPWTMPKLKPGAAYDIGEPPVREWIEYESNGIDSEIANVMSSTELSDEPAPGDTANDKHSSPSKQQKSNKKKNKLVKKKRNILGNRTDAFKATAQPNYPYELYTACFASNVEEVRRLLRDTSWDDGFHSLTFSTACSKGNMEIVKMLLDAGMEADDIAFAEACSNGHKEIAELLLELGVEPSSPYHSGIIGLERTAAAGHAELVKLLLSLGADANPADGYENTPLTAASERGHQQVVQVLLDAGADPNVTIKVHNALYRAADGGHCKTVEKLVEAGANMNRIGGRGSALHAASNGGHKECVEMLLALDADIDNGQGDYNGTPIYAAASRGHIASVKQLVDAGADTTLRGRERNMAAPYASTRSSIDGP